MSGLCGVFQDALGVKFPPLDTDEARQVSTPSRPRLCGNLSHSMHGPHALMTVAAPAVLWVGAG